MANAIYPKYKQAALSGGANHDLSAGNVKALLVDPDVAGGELVNQLVRTNIVINVATFGAGNVAQVLKPVTLSNESIVRPLVVEARPAPEAAEEFVGGGGGRRLERQVYWREERRRQKAAVRQAEYDSFDLADLADVLEALRNVA